MMYPHVTFYIRLRYDMAGESLLLSFSRGPAPVFWNAVSSEEHYLMKPGCVVPIVVYESEPSSAIAYALSTHCYQNSLAELTKTSAMDQSCR